MVTGVIGTIGQNAQSLILVKEEGCGSASENVTILPHLVLELSAKDKIGKRKNVKVP